MCLFWFVCAKSREGKRSRKNDHQQDVSHGEALMVNGLERIKFWVFDINPGLNQPAYILFFNNSSRFP